jgi:uncharacterized membrane protein YcaP (DUF421 family)
MFFDGWSDLGRVLVVGVAAYIGVVAILQVTGKRTLSKMNAFDLIVTVALGSVLASTLLSKDVSLSEGLLAIGLLCALQYAVTWAALRSERFQRLIKAEPTLLVSNGRVLAGALNTERVTREEILAALRAKGVAAPAGAAAVILETDGSLSVIPAGDIARLGALSTVEGAAEAFDPARL